MNPRRHAAAYSHGLDRAGRGAAEPGRRFCLALVLLATLCLAAGGHLAGLDPVWAGESDGPIREPAVAGRFYPDSAPSLRSAIESYLGDARPPSGAKPLGLLVPHAGYVYSGQIAADAFAQAAPYDYDLIVVLGTNHTTAGFADVSIWPGGGYRTPLGVAEVAASLASQLSAKDADFRFAPELHAREHSVEVEIPFLQVLFPGTPILTAIIGSPDAGLCLRLGRALAEVAGDRNLLVVASSDLSHYPPQAEARRVDLDVLAAFVKRDEAALLETMREHMAGDVPGLSTCACGRGPMLTLIALTRRLGATRAELISYANSGDTLLGDRERVVGYGAVAFYRDGEGAAETPAVPVPDQGLSPAADEPAQSEALEAPSNPASANVMDPAERRWLLALARESIRRYLDSGTLPLPRDESGRFDARRGAFVTLKKDGRLRGCIGHMEADLSIEQVVGRMALQAAFEDRRFSPLTREELDEIEIEISLLTPRELVAGPEDILPGRDGVYLFKDGRSAVFLPQVAVEQGWDRDTMLEHLCLKARLADDCWTEDARFYTFQAEVFGEAEAPAD